MTKINSDILVAEKIRQACVEAAKSGFRDASISGLCSDGAMEAAVSAIQSLNLVKELEKLRKSDGDKPVTGE